MAIQRRASVHLRVSWLSWGHYRFYANGKLGIHQFFFEGAVSMSGDDATSSSQILSSAIENYMQEMRVDPISSVYGQYLF